MKGLRFPGLGCLLIVALAFLPAVRGQIIISEFMAGNTKTLPDQDGEYSDWIEIYNGTRELVDLGGWYLTDSKTNFTKWRFPSTPLPANRHLVVFASGKDRTTPGSELHTDFKLTAAGEYLGLVKPDGITVASAYGPEFPVQVPDVSFGIPMRQTITTLISNGAPARLHIPANDAMAIGWTDPDWNDIQWANVKVGIGFETTNQASVPLLVADSVADFSGVQGHNGWFYGYYNRTADPVSGYQAPDFISFPQGSGSPSISNFWNGTTWDWFKGDPPWTEIGASYTRPNGVNNGAEHWAIRRWVSQVSGDITVQWRLAKQDPNGKGVTGRVLHQGVQKDIAIIAGDNTVGVAKSLVISDVKPGDFIDFALAPTGIGNATDDGSDGSLMSATVQVLAPLLSQVQSDIKDVMAGVNASAYLRIPFNITDPSSFQFLTLRMKYDDGFVAYLNGVQVLSRNAPEEPGWNSTALVARENAEAIQFEEFDLSPWLGLLHVGMNVLAIHGLNASAADPDFLIVPELRAVTRTLDLTAQRYFSLATPGAANGFGKTNLGALIVNVTPTPAMPADDQDVVVTAQIISTFEPVAKVTLFYRVMFGAELSTSMFDDGLHGDGAASDQVFGATIPASASSPGQMIRFYVTATDASGDLSRSPAYLDSKNSPQYWGTVISDPSVSNALPVLHWFVQTPNSADTINGTRASIFFAGEFYDNVAVNLHGQSSAQFPKKSYNFDLNTGYHFRYDVNQRRVEDFNLLTTYPDKSHMRNMLAYETYRDAGSAYHVVFAMRVQRNGAFFSDAHFVEDGDENYLARLGLDPNGTLYKMYNTLDSSTSGVEKKTRKSENNADLQALISGVRRTGAARTQFLWDNIDMPAMANFLAAMIITGGTDCCHKNYYAYRDSNGSGEWKYLPWDVDLTFGRNWNSANTYFDDTMFANNPLYIGSNNSLISALFANPSFKQMYLRRVRTLMDNLLQRTNTPPAELKYERRIDELAALIAPDAALDYAKWPTWGKRQTLPQAVEIMRNQYLPARRNYLFKNTEIPAAQPASASLAFGAMEFFPASGNQEEEYVQLLNTNSYAVDVSNWRVEGSIRHSFHPGTVLPARGSLYLSPNVVAFRGRATNPRGGTNLFVQGKYQGQLSSRGGILRLMDGLREVAIASYAGAPTPLQENLRITEIMYHPSGPPPGSAFVAEDFEYIQLKNIGGASLDLVGTHFTNGITFYFTNNSASRLPPGHVVYVVKNLRAFTSRYGLGLNVAGSFVGSLDNSGEKLRLDDAAGETILDFGYDNSWYAPTDGSGYALAIRNEREQWSRWGEKASWTSSTIQNGTPADEPGLALWQAQYFSADELKEPNTSGPAADPDGDHLTNAQEFASGTNPHDARSFLQIQSASIAPAAEGPVIIRFEAAAARSYTLQSCDGSIGAAWSKVCDIPKQSMSRMVEVSDNASTQGKTSRYYRLVTPQQP